MLFDLLVESSNNTHPGTPPHTPLLVTVGCRVYGMHMHMSIHMHMHMLHMYGNPADPTRACNLIPQLEFETVPNLGRATLRARALARAGAAPLL